MNVRQYVEFGWKDFRLLIDRKEDNAEEVIDGVCAATPRGDCAARRNVRHRLRVCLMEL
jgi:hypothetical protein